MNTKMTFTERITRLKSIAQRLHELGNMHFHNVGITEDLQAAAEVILSEAQHMEASAQRFAEKRATEKRASDNWKKVAAVKRDGTCNS